MHEGGHICRFLQYFRIRVIVDKGQQLVKNPLNVRDLFEIACDHGHLREQALLFAPELLVELCFQLHLFFVKFAVEVRETLVDVFELLLLQAGQLVPGLVQQL